MCGRISLEVCWTQTCIRVCEKIISKIRLITIAKNAVSVSATRPWLPKRLAYRRLAIVRTRTATAIQAMPNTGMR